jgi:hypothetical protein
MCIQEMSPYSVIKIRVSALPTCTSTVDRLFAVHSLNSLRGFLIDVVRAHISTARQCWTNPHSNELTCGPTELVQHFLL